MAAGPRKASALGLVTTPAPYTHASPTILADTSPEPQAAEVDKAAQQEWLVLYDHLESRFQALYTWRVPWWTTWGQIARYMKPHRYYYFQTQNTYDRGLREDQLIVDRSATLCGEVCAAGLMATLTDPDREWLKLGPAVPNLDLPRDAKQYYEDLTQRVNYVLDHSNFYGEQAQVYDDLTFFGTGVAIDYEDARSIIRTRVPCAGEFLLGVGFDNGDEVFYEEFRQTVSATVEMFGEENCPQDILNMWRQKGGALEYENVIGHSIEPNFAIAGTSNTTAYGVVPGGFTWRECFWIRGKKNLRPLSLTGFHEQPFATSRWNTQGNDAYGRGVGENMLGDTIQLQLETRQKAESIEKVNRPPMGADVELQNQPASIRPGAITYMNTAGGNGEKKFWSLFGQFRPDIPALSADIKLIQDRISRTAYNDVFQIMMTLRQQLELKADVTATEVDQLTQEVLMRVGPMLWRSYNTMQQRVRRILAIMSRRGLLPKKPQSLQGVPIKIELISLLTEAKQKAQTGSIARSIQFGGSISGAFPEVKMAYDAVEAVRQFNDGVGAPSKLIRTDSEIQMLVNREKQSQQQQQLLQQTLPGAKAAQALSSTSLQPGSALAALVGGGAG